jgi:acetate kinase
MKILVLNAGSSSQKSCLYELNGDTLPEQPPHPLWQAQLDWIDRTRMAELHVKTAGGKTIEQTFPSESRQADTLRLLETLWTGETQQIDRLSDIDIVGHRVVHGGAEYRCSTFIDAAVKKAIERLISLAPAHNPANLEGIEAIEQILGSQVPQVAVFDTAFHATMPESATIYPIPYEWFEGGIRRYGFHGISHQYCARRAAKILNRDLESLRLITCHLGNGCSLAAIRDGYSIDTTMGFTPLDGLMMGSRSGSIDPGILLYMLQYEGMTVLDLDEIFHHASGLKGISDISSDMRQILEAMAAGNARAKLAFDAYIHKLRSHIGAMLASLGGLDVLVFAAGVGENAAIVRAQTCSAFAFLGVKLDAEKNEQHPIDCEISTPDSTVRVLVIHTEEDWAIAQECWQLVNS